MGQKKDITSKEKQDIVKLLSDANTTLEIEKKSWKEFTEQSKKIRNKNWFWEYHKKRIEKNEMGNKQEKWIDQQEIFQDADALKGDRKKNENIKKKKKQTLVNDIETTKLLSLIKQSKEKHVKWVK